jgi:hypothetical protein
MRFDKTQKSPPQASNVIGEKYCIRLEHILSITDEKLLSKTKIMLQFIIVNFTIYIA